MKKMILMLCLFLSLALISCSPEPMEPTVPPTPIPSTQEPAISAPLGVNTNLSPEEIAGIKSYWAYDSDWAMSMPSTNGWNPDTRWSVGLGDAYESTLGLPYEGLDIVSEAAQDLVALSFGTVEYCYFDGFSTVIFRDFYGDQPSEPEYSVTYYISTTQPDCETPQGIHPGNTLEERFGGYVSVLFAL